MNRIKKHIVKVLCGIAKSSLHSTSIRGNYQTDVRELKKSSNKKKLLTLLVAFSLLLPNTTNKIVAEESTGNTKTDINETILDNGLKIIVETVNNKSSDKIVRLIDEELVLVYDTRTNLIINEKTNEIVATISEENIQEPLKFQNSGIRSYSYGGITIADRWVYSYSTDSTISVANYTFQLVINSIIIYLVGKSANPIYDVLAEIADKLIVSHISVYGNTNDLAYVIRTRRYANRYILSDFANIYEEVDASGSILAVSGYDVRITKDNG